MIVHAVFLLIFQFSYLGLQDFISLLYLYISFLTLRILVFNINKMTYLLYLIYIYIYNSFRIATSILLLTL